MKEFCLVRIPSIVNPAPTASTHRRVARAVVGTETATTEVGMATAVNGGESGADGIRMIQSVRTTGIMAAGDQATAGAAADHDHILVTKNADETEIGKEIDGTEETATATVAEIDEEAETVTMIVTVTVIRIAAINLRVAHPQQFRPLRQGHLKPPRR